MEGKRGDFDQWRRVWSGNHLIEFEPINHDDERLTCLFQDPYIQRVGYDDRPAQAIDHPAVHYFAVLVDGRFVGAYALVESGFHDWDVHSYLTKECLPISRVIGRDFIRYAFDCLPIARLTALILGNLQSAVNYCLKVGFSYEGFKRDALMKDGRLIGLHILGITRKES